MTRWKRYLVGSHRSFSDFARAVREAIRVSRKAKGATVTVHDTKADTIFYVRAT